MSEDLQNEAMTNEGAPEPRAAEDPVVQSSWLVADGDVRPLNERDGR